jgi:hypothetical protein
VILTIWYFICGANMNFENGTLTEIPGCKTKLELRSRKKIIRNTTSSSGKIINHPN